MMFCNAPISSCTAGSAGERYCIRPSTANCAISRAEAAWKSAPLFAFCSYSPVRRGGTPFCFCFGLVLVEFAGVKCGKVHGFNSFFLDLAGEGDKPVDVLPLPFQKPDLLRQGFLRIKMGIVENGFDLFERELQFAKKQDALQTAKRRIVIQPVACLRYAGGRQKADGVIVVKRAHTYTRLFADLTYGFHPYPSLARKQYKP